MPSECLSRFKADFTVWTLVLIDRHCFWGLRPSNHFIPELDKYELDGAESYIARNRAFILDDGLLVKGDCDH